MQNRRQQILRSLPSVEELLTKEPVGKWIDRYSRSVVVTGVRQVLADLRQQIIGGSYPGEEINEADICRALHTWLERETSPSLRKVINATGIILHTNLGRAPLAAAALAAIADTAGGYSNLEYELASGERGSRYRHVEQLITELTGAEGALVVNNNAAAVMLVLSTIANEKEVIISRGQLVEIGGSFRIPDVMAQSGAKLVEVGTTNRTHLRDYRGAINEATGMLLRVHASNFQITGFTAEVSARELSQLGQEHDVPVYEDQGSGTLVRLAGMPQAESTVQEAVAAGVDIVSFSGDKMLGGAQAGIIVGKKAYIDRMKRHPLLRAFRIDKLSLAALEATLRLYKQGDAGRQKIPFIRMFTASREVLDARAQQLSGELAALHSGSQVSVVEVAGQAGGGSLPGEEFPSVAVGLVVPGVGLQEAAALLRQAEIPVICRGSDDLLLFDVRTIADEDIPWIVQACKTLMDKGGLNNG